MTARTLTLRIAFALSLGIMAAGCSRAVAASVPGSSAASASCPAELHVLAVDPGFRSETPGSTLDPDRTLRGGVSAGVTAVASSHLDLLTASGVVHRFHWTGPALPFTVGERLTFERADGWDTVRNNRFTASAFRYEAETLQPTPPVDVANGPSFRFTESCARPAEARCAAGSEPRRVFALEVTVGEHVAHVLPGSTATVGSWQVTNIASDLAPACACSADCAGSMRAAAQVTILGPTAL